MSKTIDERVVSLQFDNKNFEANVRTSMGTLAKLKQSLKLKGASDGLEQVEKSIKKFDVSPMTKGLDTVKVKFGELQLLAYKYLDMINDKIVSTSKKLVSSLTIDNVASGWQKYADKTSNVQTIMNATGKSIDEVNTYLEKLMWFSDETSYGFTDMTAALGQFTAAGADIDNVIPMITGIANATAYAGKSTQDFSRVLYNLNQSYSGGFLNYQDWKSVELAGVASKELKQVLIDTAIELGTLSKEGKAANGELVTIANMGTTLNQKWATKDVMEKAFGKFSAFSEEVYKLVQSGECDTAAEAIERLSGKYDWLAETAFKSAQEAKTFNEAIEATKDAVSSGWMKTFELIFGNYEQAKVLWTDLANGLWDVFASGAERRNEMIEKALTSPYQKFMKQLKDAGISQDKFIAKMKEVTKLDAAIDYQIQKYGGSLEKAIQAGAVSASVMEQTFSAFNEDLAQTNEELEKITETIAKGSTGENVEAIQKALKDLGYDLGEFGKDLDGVDGIMGTFTEDAVKAFQEAEGLEITGVVDEATLARMKELTSTTYDLSKVNSELLKEIDQLGGRDKLIQGFKDLLSSFVDVLDSVKAAWRSLIYGEMEDDEILEKQSNTLLKLIENFQKFASSLRLTEEESDKLMRTFRGLFAALDIIRMVLGGGLNLLFTVLKETLSALNIGFLDAAADIGDAVYMLRNWIKEHELIPKVVGVAVRAIVGFITKIIEFVRWVSNIPAIQQIFRNLASSIRSTFSTLNEYFGGAGTVIGDFIDRCLELDGFTWENFKIALKDFKESVVGYFLGAGNIISDFLDDIVGSISAIDDFLYEHVGLYRTIKDIFVAVFDGLCSAIINFKTEYLILGATLFGVFKLVKGVVGFAGDVISAIADIKDSVVNVLNGFAKVEKSISRTFNALAIKYLGDALLAIASALAILAFIPMDTLMPRAIMLGIILLALTGALSLITFIAKGTTLKDIGKAAALISAMGLCMLQLAIASAILSQVSSRKIEEMEYIMLEVSVIVGILMGVSKLGKGSNFAGVASIFKAIGKCMLELAAAMLIMNFVKPSSVGKLFAVILMVGGVVGLLTLIASYDKNGNVDKAADVIKSMGKALLMISVALIIMNFVTEDAVSKLLSVIVIFGVACFALIAIGKYDDGIQDASNTIKAFGMSLLMISAAMLIMDHVSDAAVARMLAIMIAFGAIMTLFVALNKFKAEVKDVSNMIISFGAALLLISVALKIIDTIGIGGIAKGILVMSSIRKLMVQVIKSTENSKDAMKSILAMSAFILATSFALLLLSKCDPASLAVASIAVSSIMLVMSKLLETMQSVSSGSKKVSNAMKELLIMTIIMGVIGGIIALLSNLVDPQGAIASATAMSEVLLAMAASMYVLSTLDKRRISTKKVISTLASMSAILIAVGVVVSLLEAANLVPSLESALALSTLAVSMGVACLAVAAAGVLATGAVAGIAALGVFMLALSGLALAMANVSDEFSEKIADGANKIANIIGGFVGNLVGSIFSAATEHLSLIADNLNIFMDKLTGDDGFLEKAKKFQGVDLKPIKDMASALLVLTGTSILDGLTFFLKKDFSGYGEKLGGFADGVVQFAEKIQGKNIDPDEIGKVAEAGKKLAELNKAIPATGGTWQKWAGTKDLAEWGSKLVEFAKQFVLVCAAFDLGEVIIDSQGVQTAIDVAGKLAELNDAIPKNDGFLQTIMGEKDIGAWGLKIASFAKGLYAFGQELDEFPLNSTEISNISGIGKALAEINNALPNTGGLISLFTGDESMEDFADGIADFGLGLANFADALKDVDGSNIKDIVDNVGRPLVDLLNDDGMTTFLDNTQQYLNSQSFGDNLKNFGTGISGFATELEGVSFDNASAAFQALYDMGKIWTGEDNGSTIVEFMNALGDKSISSASEQMSAIGSAVAAFAEPFSTINPDTVNNASTITSAVAAILLTLVQNELLSDEVLLAKTTSFSATMTSLGTGLSDFGTECEKIKVTKIQSVTTALTSIFGLLKVFADAINTGMQLDVVLSDLGTGFADFAESTSELGEINPNIIPILEALSTTATGDFTLLKNIVAIANSFDFSTAMTDLGSGVKTFAAFSSNINVQNVQNGITALAAFADGWGANANIDSLLTTMSMDNISDTFGKAMENVGAGVAALITSLADVKIGNARGAATAFNEIMTGLALILIFDSEKLSRLTLSLSLAGTSVKSFVTTIGGISKSTLDTAKTNMDSIKELMDTIPKDSAQQIKDALDNMFMDDTDQQVVLTKVETFLSNIEDKIKEHSDNFEEVGGDFGSSMVDGIGSKSTDFANKVKTMVNTAKEGIIWNYESFKSAGAFLADGLIAGIKSKTIEVYNAAYQMGKTAVTGELKGQESNSPSKATIRAGKYLGQGLIIGIDNMSSAVYAAANNMGKMATDPINGIVASVSTALAEGVSGDDLTIRPVLDLSEIENGANTIGSMLSANSQMSVYGSALAINRSMSTRQNGNSELLSAINNLGNNLGKSNGNTYNINGITYDDGSNVQMAVESLVRAAIVERRA